MLPALLTLTLAGLRIPTTQPGYATMTVQAAGDTTVMWTHYLLSNHDDLFVLALLQRWYLNQSNRLYRMAHA